MTALDDRPPVPPSTRVLQLVGIILILTFILDFAIRLTVTEFANEQWQLTMMNEFIDRGIMPLIGLALIYAGFGLKRQAGIPPSSSASAVAWADPNFWTFVFASLLGLLFLLVIPFHYTQTGAAADQALKTLDEQVAQQARNLNDQQRLFEQSKQQWQAIAKDPKQIDLLLQRPQLQPQEKAILEQLKRQDSATREQTAQSTLVRIDEQLKQVETRQTELDEQKQKSVNRANSERFLARFRAALRSVLLAVGFAWIGWTGLRDAR